jgi:hypothetical protein
MNEIPPEAYEGQESEASATEPLGLTRLRKRSEIRRLRFRFLLKSATSKVALRRVAASLHPDPDLGTSRWDFDVRDQIQMRGWQNF